MWTDSKTLITVKSKNPRAFVLLNSESGKCLECEVTETDSKFDFYLLNVRILANIYIL